MNPCKNSFPASEERATGTQEVLILGLSTCEFYQQMIHEFLAYTIRVNKRCVKYSKGKYQCRVHPGRIQEQSYELER